MTSALLRKAAMTAGLAVVAAVVAVGAGQGTSLADPDNYTKKPRHTVEAAQAFATPAFADDYFKKATPAATPAKSDTDYDTVVSDAASL